MPTTDLRALIQTAANAAGVSSPALETRPLTDAELVTVDAECRECGERLNAYEADAFGRYCGPCAQAECDLL